MSGSSSGTGGWEPPIEECTSAKWAETNIPPFKPIVAKDRNSNSTEKAYCMEVYYACFKGSKIVPAGSGYCLEEPGIIFPDSKCSDGRYEFPFIGEFDLGARSYMVTEPSEFTGIPWSGSSDPGKIRLRASSRGEFGDQHYRNADETLLEQQNQIERYLSLCQPAGGDYGCLLPSQNAGNSYQWASWIPETILPFDCLPPIGP
jgi:hypothetical protein